MRTPSLLVAAVLGGALSATALSAPPSSARQAAPRSAPLRGLDCLDPAHARGFVDLDRHRLLVDAGHDRYLIEISPACRNVDIASVIGFRGEPIDNRVCGSGLDRILVRGSVPCRIDGIRMVGKDEYRQLLRQREELRQQRKAERAAAKDD